jgi:hypothetical protein
MEEPFTIRLANGMGSLFSASVTLPFITKLWATEKYRLEKIKKQMSANCRIPLVWISVCRI